MEVIHIADVAGLQAEASLVVRHAMMVHIAEIAGPRAQKEGPC